MKKRLLSLLLVLVLVLGMLPASVLADDSVSNTADVYLTISSGGVLQLVNAKVTVTDLDSDGVLTYEEALIAGHKAYHPDGEAGYRAQESGYGSFVVRLWGVENGGSAYFYMNDRALSYGVSNTDHSTVTDGDRLYAANMVDTMSYTDKYTYFTEQSVTAEAGSAFTLTLSFEDGTAASGVTIGTWSDQTFTALEGKTTDENGQVTLSFAEAGTYCVSATGPVAGTDWNGNAVDCPIFPPVCVVTVEGVPFEGTGTVEDPYLIQTAEDLVALSGKVAAGESFADCYFKMTADITLPADWTPLGVDRNSPFSGSFDGGDHLLTVPEGGLPLIGTPVGASLSDLNVYGSKIAGYGVVNNYCEIGKVHAITIENVTLKSGTQTLQSGFIGGYASGSDTVTIRNCTVEEGVVIGYDKAQMWVGSFAGEFNGTIENCVSYATVYGTDFVGGIVSNKGQSMGDFTVSGCQFHGDVIATGNYVGGIVGHGYGGTKWGFSNNGGIPTITNCTATGSITGGNYVGGIYGGDAGVVQVWENAAGSITDNRFTGTVSATGGEYVGAIIGYLKSLNKYNTISDNIYIASCGASKGIGFVMYVDTSCETHETGSGATYFNTAEGKPGITGVTKTDHNRTDDPLGADAESLCRAEAAPASVIVTVDGTELEVTSLGSQSYPDTWGDPVSVPFFTVKVNEGSDFVIDGSAVGTVNAFHVSSGASLYGTHPYTMTAATLEAYFLMSAEDFNARFTFDHGLNTENKVAFIEARNSGDRVYCLLVELLPGSGESEPDPEPVTIPVSVTADDAAVEVIDQGTFADKQWWGSSQIPVYYAEVPEDAAVSITYSEDYLALGSDYFTEVAPTDLTGMTKADLESYFTTASDYGLDTENSVAYIEFSTNDGYFNAAFGLLIELIPVSEPEPEPAAGPVSVTADDAAVDVTYQGAFADKQYWGSTQIPVYYAEVPEDAAISVSYGEDYLALGSDYFSSLEPSALTGMTKTDLESYFTTASDYGLDTENSVAYIEFASNDGYYTAAFGLLIELAPSSEPVETFPVSVTADDVAVEVTNQGMFGNKMYYGSSQIPVYYAKVPAAAVLSITYSEEYSALDSIYLFSIDPIELMGITGADLEAWFTTASDYGLSTANNVAYIEFRASDFNPAFGLLIELEAGDEVPCEHQWQDATCTAPRTCLLCGATEGEALGHDFVNGECTRCDAVKEATFEDVPVGSFFFDPVEWAVEEGITTGATATTFDPNGSCLRGHVVTFLWRAAGSPEPTSTENPFTDVKESDFFYKAVLWAVENEITNGLSADKFGPYALCNRAQVVTFLWRSQGSPASDAEVVFTDVQAGQFYTTAVAWAVENGVTNGLSATEFGVSATCNRAQVVTFLYRALAK